jgi:predicted nucleotidyltransferase
VKSPALAAFVSYAPGQSFRCDAHTIGGRRSKSLELRKSRSNIRNMRKHIPALDSLFSGVRRDVLAATLTQPEKWWYLSELAQFLHTRPSSLQRELVSLEQSGILQQRTDGRRRYFKAETRSPIFRELRSIFEKTVGLIPTLRDVLQAFAEKIACTFVYGSVARREERATSDVDLMVIGDVGLAELAPSLRKAEMRLGREVNVTSYSVAEFRKKVSQNDHFLTSVLKGGGLQFVKGEQRDLDAITGKQRGSATQNIEKGIGQAAGRHTSRFS